MKTDVELMIVGLRGQMTRVLWSIGGRPNVGGSYIRP